MGKSGNVNITNIKAATGIADNRLSAHTTAGVGSQTKMSDFFIAGFDYSDNSFAPGKKMYVGDRPNPATPFDTPVVFLPNPTDPNKGPNDGVSGDDSLYPGQLDIIPGSNRGSGFGGRVEALENMVQGCLSLSVPPQLSLLDIVIKQPQSSNARMIGFRFDVLRSDTQEAFTVTWNEPGVNGDKVPFDATANPATWGAEMPVIYPIRVTNIDESNLRGSFDYDISDSDPARGVDVLIERRSREGGTTSWNSWIQADSFNASADADGTYTHSIGQEDAPAPEGSRDYQWRVNLDQGTESYQQDTSYRIASDAIF